MKNRIIQIVLGLFSWLYVGRVSKKETQERERIQEILLSGATVSVWDREGSNLNINEPDDIRKVFYT
jgi:hypothetical protein